MKHTKKIQKIKRNKKSKKSKKQSTRRKRKSRVDASTTLTASYGGYYEEDPNMDVRRTVASEEMPSSPPRKTPYIEDNGTNYPAFSDFVNQKTQGNNETIPNSTIVLVCLTHGVFDSETLIKVPETIKKFSKINHSPFGKLSSAWSNQTHPFSHTSFLNHMVSYFSTNQIENMDGNQIATRLCEIIGKNIPAVPEGNHPDKVYQTPTTDADKWKGFTYNKESNPEFKILNKIFKTLKEEDIEKFKFIMNIYVVYCTAGTSLSPNVISSLDPNANNVDMLIEKGLFNYDSQIPEIITNTQEIVNIMANCGYENVIMVDFTCNQCINPLLDESKKISIRGQIREGTIGSG